jgi:MFS family permease
MSNSASLPDANAPWYKQLNGYHWFVFFVASAAWCFDCLDQQLFILARDNAVKALSPGVDSLAQGKLSGWAMSVFIAGWATGGLIFGAVGDRIGRAKTLAITVLIYSLFTGLSRWSLMRCLTLPVRRRLVCCRRSPLSAMSLPDFVPCRSRESIRWCRGNTCSGSVPCRHFCASSSCCV